jgi:hypothetical protein
MDRFSSCSSSLHLPFVLSSTATVSNASANAYFLPSLLQEQRRTISAVALSTREKSASALRIFPGPPDLVLMCRLESKR